MSRPTTSLSALDFKQAVALQFADRPTLRQVAAQKILQLVVEHYPVIGAIQPPLIDAEPLRLIIPQSANSGVQQSLVQVVLQAVLDASVLNLERVNDGVHGLFPAAPHRFEGSGDHEFFAIEGMSDAFNALVLELPYHFQQAQVDYWHGESSSGVSRDRWLQQTLKSALLRNLSLQGLDSQQQECIHGLLKGGAERPAVFTVEVQLETDGEPFLKMLPNLLVIGEWDERTVVLWCAPSSVVKCFDSLDSFASALGDELAGQYRFESMSWNRFELEGDVHSQQAALLLDAMLGSVQRLRYSTLADVAKLEQAYAALCDPSQWFIENYFAVIDVNAEPPPGLLKASAGDSFAYQCALFDLALTQAESKGRSALDNLLDLHSFASQCLREQLLADYPDEANYLPDDLNLTLTVARGIPGGAGAGVGGGSIETRTMTLTQFAIGNLSSLQGATLTAIEHREGQLIMAWMNINYVKSLVEQVDIGGRYPHYVAQKLDDPINREQRVSCFAREWRSSLLFSALAAKVDGSLSEGGLQCVADYCAGRVDRNVPAITLMPLAFKREPTASQADLVHGMYVFFSVQPTTVLLYRPLYAKAPLMEFPSLEAMLVAIRQTGALQDSILDWVAPDARSVYDYGGFSEPHLGRPIIDTSLLPEAVQPASLALQFWGLNVDAKMYSANRDLLVELADRQSVSNTESHWALLTEGAWLLFDVATLLVRGPVATVAWLVQAIRGVQSDFSALTQGNHFEKSLAVVDLILNLGMALFHVHLPRRELPVFGRLPEASDMDGPRRQGPGYGPVALTPTQGKVGLPGALSEQRATQLDFTWRGGNGLNMLAPVQRETLLAMRSAVPLNGLKPLGSGSARGLYLVEGRYYVALAGDTYAVQRSAEGVHVVDGQGHPGPWLSFEWNGWRVDGGLRLRGGMPKSRRQIQEEANRKQLEENREREAGLARRHNELAQQFSKLKAFLAAKDAQIEALENEVEPDDLKVAELAGLKSLRKLTNLKVVYALKPLIENGFTHDKVVSDIAKMSRLEPILADVIGEQRSSIRQELIDNCSVFYNELATIINNEGVDKLAEAVAIRPESEAEVEQYRHFLVSLEKVVGWETDLVELSRTFDVLLEDTLKDNSIVFKGEAGTKANKNREVGEIIARRREAAVDLDVRLLLDLAELSLDRLASVDASVLEQYHNYLAGESLTSAGTAHGDLAGSGLALTEQIEVLNGIVEAYDETLVLVDYLHTLGGAAIKSDKLQLYKAELSSLKNAAVSELSQAVREQELEMPRLPRPSLYAARGGKRRLVRTQRGRSVLAEEFEVDGVAVVQQRESRTGRVLKQFHQQGNEWVEAVSPPVEEVAPPVASKNPAADRSRARTLIGEVDAVITLAHQYSPDQPLGLSSVIEGHTEKMHETLASLSLSSPDDELSEELDSNIRRLSNARRDMLISLYLNTKHPTANSLRFLHQERRITIESAVRRKALSASDFLDVYEVRRLAEHGQAKGDGLWEAHFHYPSIDTPARQFSKGHLKVWWQRKLGREAQLRAAGAGKELLEIYRSELRLPDVEGIIPFD